MILAGRAFRFGDDINTDYIIASKYKAQNLRIEDAAAHLMEDVRPGFATELRPGDLIVAGRNFGCGSSREAAPRVIKAAGVGAVLAASFARIFFRNCMNLGLAAVACPEAVEVAHDGSAIVIDPSGAVEVDGRRFAVPAAPALLTELAEAGGLVAWTERELRAR